MHLRNKIAGYLRYNEIQQHLIYFSLFVHQN